MEPWYAPQPCSTCGHPVGPRGVFVALQVLFCATCIPLVMGLLEVPQPHEIAPIESALRTPNWLSLGASS